MTTFRKRESRMPFLAGAIEWLGSEPLTSAGPRGRVVLIDFATYTLHQLAPHAPLHPRVGGSA